MYIELKDIRLDGGTQPRVDVNQDVVNDYADLLLEGVQMPKMEVFFDGISYWLVDGFHRYFAHKKAAITRAECLVHNGTLRDAVLYSLGANEKHGLRRSNEDKRKAVMIMLDDLEWSDWSDHVIAKHCKVSHMTVSRVRKSLNLQAQTEKKFVHKSGTKSVMKIAEKPAPAPTQSNEPLQEMIAVAEDLQYRLDEATGRLAIGSLDLPEEAKQQQIERYEEILAENKTLKAELAAVKVSRDQLQSKVNDMLKQIAYWKRKSDKEAA